jgi:site-specific recombinase XerD
MRRQSGSGWTDGFDLRKTPSVTPALSETSRLWGIVESLGPKAAVPLEALSTEDFLQFKEHRLKAGLDNRSINLALKILKRPFKIAADEGHLDRNPAAAVTDHANQSGQERRFLTRSDPATDRCGEG